MSGDTHLPDVESELPLEGGSGEALGTEGTQSGRGGLAGGAVKKAGLLRDPDVAGGPDDNSAEGDGE
jgi:hypothetical protein